MSTDEAARVVVDLDRSRLQAGRELRGLSQVALARDTGVTAAAISQFEKGHARPSAQTLVRLGGALQLPLSYFARRAGGASRTPPPFFRSLRSTSAGERRRAAALVGLVHELVNAIEEHVALPECDLPPRASATDQHHVEQSAAAARLHLGLHASEPVPDVVRALERRGIITARFKVDAIKMDAFSVAYPSRPVVVLGSDKGHRDRSRFDAAHELGHLVLHGPDDAGTKSAENQAHQFAAAFLMPADAIRDELPHRADWERLIVLKREWGVSIAALLRRALNLGVMDQATYTQAMKTMSARGWRTVEPGNLGPAEQPMLLAKALGVAGAHDVTLRSLAEKHGLPLADLQAIIQPLVDPRPAVHI